MAQEVKQEYYTAVGRRKTATARVKLLPGKDGFRVNGKEIEVVFSQPSHKIAYMKPMQLTNTLGSFTVEAKVEGGGLESQVDAYVLGVSRALLKINPQFRAKLKPYGLLTRDPRMKESRKYGLAGKARKKKSSPKR